VLALSSCVYDWDVGAPAPVDAGGEAGDAGGGGGPSCATLSDDLDAARRAAKDGCVLGVFGQCDGFVVDPCGCKSFVMQGSESEVQAFEAAAAAFEGAGCAASCQPCTAATTGTCLLVGGEGPYCTP